MDTDNYIYEDDFEDDEEIIQNFEGLKEKEQIKLMIDVDKDQNIPDLRKTTTNLSQNQSSSSKSRPNDKKRSSSNNRSALAIDDMKKKNTS